MKRSGKIIVLNVSCLSRPEIDVLTICKWLLAHIYYGFRASFLSWIGANKTAEARRTHLIFYCTFGVIIGIREMDYI